MYKFGVTVHQLITDTETTDISYSFHLYSVRKPQRPHQRPKEEQVSTAGLNPCLFDTCSILLPFNAVIPGCQYKRTQIQYLTAHLSRADCNCGVLGLFPG
jgi:hypothetical protein